MKKILLLIPLLALIVVLSGCVIPGGSGSSDTQTTKGAVITDFEPDFAEVDSGQEVRFRLRVKNLGEVVATDVKATLESIPDNWEVTKAECDLGTLERKQGSLEGGEASCEFIAKVIYPANTETVSKPVARVTYKYKTSTTAFVSIINIDEARRLNDAKKLTSSSETRETTTNSPISISIKFDSPVKLFSDSLNFPLKLDFQNADGTVCHPDCSDPKNYYKVNYQFSWGSKLSEAAEIPCKQTETIDLFKGEDQSLTCRLQAKDVQTSVESLLQIDADYGYLIQKSTSVRVRGRAPTS